MTKADRERWAAAVDSVVFPPEFSEIIKDAFKNYQGDITVFESAVGALFLGAFIGWQPLFIIHSPKTIRRYEAILGIGFRDLLPDSTTLSDRSGAYVFAKGIHDFWSAVSGNTSVADRKLVNGIDGQEVSS